MTIIVDSNSIGSTENGLGIHVGDLLRRFRNIMLDMKSVRWSEPEAIDWMNDGATEIVLRRPAARAITERVALAPGTFQRASEGAAQVMDVIRNIGSDGLPGRTIRIADRQQIDDAKPEWHNMRAAPTRHYMVDERSPTTFYVYPPAIDGAVVEMLVSKPAPTVLSADDTLDMRPEFINAILNWMIYRAHTKDSEYSQGAVAALHYQAFTDAIGAPAQAAQVNSATGNSA
jgi:hypothetical protein